MTDCRHCEFIDNCQFDTPPNDCEDFVMTFEYYWEMLDDIEREEYNSYDAENEEE